MLVSPNLEKYYFSYRLQFSYTNNVEEYETLIQGLQLAQHRGIKFLKVFGDSTLVVNQVKDQNITKIYLLKVYKHRVWDLLKDFQAFNIQPILRIKNKHVDRLVVVGTQYDLLENITNKKEQHIRLVVRPAMLDNDTN